MAQRRVTGGGNGAFPPVRGQFREGLGTAQAIRAGSGEQIVQAREIIAPRKRAVTVEEDHAVAARGTRPGVAPAAAATTSVLDQRERGPGRGALAHQFRRCRRGSRRRPRAPRSLPPGSPAREVDRGERRGRAPRRGPAPPPRHAGTRPPTTTTPDYSPSPRGVRP